MGKKKVVVEAEKPTGRQAKLQMLEKNIIKFFKENDEFAFNDSDVIMLFKNLTQRFANNKLPFSYIMRGEELSKQSKDDFNIMWEGFVQDVIDYVNNHSDVKNKILTTSTEIQEAWAKEGINLWPPDTTFYFGFDNMEEALEHGNWTAGTDSYIGISVANKDVLYMV